MDHKSIELKTYIKSLDDAYLKANKWMEENPGWMWTGDYSVSDEKSYIKVAKSIFPEVKDSKLVAIQELTV